MMQTSLSGAAVEEGPGGEDPLPHIALIFDVIEDLPHGDHSDLVADQEVIDTARSAAHALVQLGYSVTSLPIRRLSDIPLALAPFNPAETLVLNLCDSPAGVAIDEPQVPRLLRALGFPYTGSSANTLAACLDKARTKRALRVQGLLTAPFQVCRSDRAIPQVPFPVIVKPIREDASLGITRDAVVTSRESLRRQIAYVLENYRQPALVEAFILGREFNVSIWGNGTLHLLPLSELDFGDWPDLTRFCHFQAKWDETALEYETTYVRCPADVESELGEAIMATAVRAYEIMGCADYARVDIRMQGGAPYVLEVNPNPCLAIEGGFARSAAAAGYSYAHMLGQIVKWAWRRRHARHARMKRLVS
jgi:D-alanine-D-alanine ligase